MRALLLLGLLTSARSVAVLAAVGTSTEPPERDPVVEALHRDSRVVAMGAVDLHVLDSWASRLDGVEVAASGHEDMPLHESGEMSQASALSMTLQLPTRGDGKRLVTFTVEPVEATSELQRFALKGRDNNARGELVREAAGRIEGSIYLDGEFYAVIRDLDGDVTAALLDDHRVPTFESIPADPFSILEGLQQQQAWMRYASSVGTTRDASPLWGCERVYIRPAAPEATAPPPQASPPKPVPVFDILPVLPPEACIRRAGDAKRCAPNTLSLAIELETLTALLQTATAPLVEAFQAEGTVVDVRVRRAVVGPAGAGRRFCDTLANARLGPDYADLRAARRSTKADVMVVLVPESASGITRYRPCGLTAVINVENADEAVVLVNTGCVNSQTLAHELGHLLGASHEPTALVVEGVVAADPMAHGYIREDKAIGTLVSVKDNSKKRIARWSNPTAQWAMAPDHYTAIGAPSCCHDAVLVKRNLTRLAGLGDQ